MRKDPLLFIEDILDSIRAIRAYTKGLTREAFQTNLEKQDAVHRRLEIIGEAANRLEPDFKTHHCHIPWAQIIGMRNLLIHGYDQINLDLVWETVMRDLPILEGKIFALLESPPDKG
ncbi:MAG: DUF86 domain-containing protein [Desulfobacterales bacterium]|nr:DUF86 domain-containing protein [Desulfobacterales bacterium]